MRVPSYRRHSSGNARVTINGKDHLLGQYDSKASREKYDRLIAEYKASRKSKAFGKSDLLMQDVLLAFIRYAKEYYKGTTNPYRFKVALRPVKDLYATLPAAEFGPKQFKAVRQSWIDEGDRCRRYINEQMGMVARMVKWAVAEELMHPDQLTRIRAVTPLERGRTEVRESEPIESVPLELIENSKVAMTPILRDMVELQLLTGCRPGELVRICPGMVDRSGEIWTISLREHKTARKGKSRTIYVGPKAQQVLLPYLLRPDTKPCFSPQESEKQRRLSRHEARRTPLSCGNRPGTNKLARKPRVEPGEAYTAGSYRKAVLYACLRVYPYPRGATSEQKRKWRAKYTWSPNQLRHNAGTEIRREFGLEAAQVILGHSKANVTQVYAETNHAKALEVAKQFG
jgi:integrase